MYNKKSVNTLIIFAIFTLIIIFQSFTVKRIGSKALENVRVQKDQESEFFGLNYYAIDGERKVLSVNASILKIINEKNLYFSEPEGFVLNNKDEKVSYSASKGSFLTDKKALNLEGDVILVNAKSEHKSDSLFYDGQSRIIKADGNVNSKVVDPKTADKILIKASKMSAWLNEGKSVFTGSVVGKVKRKRIYEESFDFKSEKIEVNQLKSLVKLSNNVKLHRGNYNLSAGKAEIFLGNYNKKLKYYVLYDDIKLVEKLDLRNGRKQQRRAYSEKLEGYMSEAKVVLSGAPRVQQGNDLIKGYQITLRENVEIVEVDDSQSSFELKRK